MTINPNQRTWIEEKFGHVKVIPRPSMFGSRLSNRDQLIEFLRKEGLEVKDEPPTR